MVQDDIEWTPPVDNADDEWAVKIEKCEQCLEAGNDYCIEDNVCIQRGTTGCNGQEDHITGSEEFECEDGRRHSMVNLILYGIQTSRAKY